MSYQSFSFLAFSAVVIFFYYILGKRCQRAVLALANLAFYAIAGVEYIPFILVTMVATYLTGRGMGRIYNKADGKLALCTTPKEKKEVRADAKKKAKKVLLLGMFVTIALLVVCKYTSFIIENVNKILGMANIPEIKMFDMILPLGVSFYSFMALSYVLDVFWKRYKAEKNFLTYAVYLSYFPHVVQGPIDRFNEFKEQIKDGVAIKWENITQGAQLTLWGLFKKLVVADRLGILVSHVLDNWENTNGMMLFFAIAVYSIQIYTDFSGCIDIVTGISEMMGIKLRKNFNHPYFSKTMAEFWRRWHISLQEWFKDYVYYPVSASAFMRSGKKFFKEKNKPRAMELFSSCVPVLVVWLITGIWHGAAWKFVAWGLFHAAVLIGSQIFEPLFKKTTTLLKINTENFGWRFWQMTRTFIICCIGRIFFRADGLGDAVGILKTMVKTPGTLGDFFSTTDAMYGMDGDNFVIAVVAVAILWIVDILQEKMARENSSLRKSMAEQNIIFRWILIFGLIFAILIFGIYGPGYDASSFIYEQF